MASRVTRKGPSVSDARRAIQALPVKAAIAVAAATAPALNAQVQSDFGSGRTAYGEARPEGTHGPVTLHKSGRLQALLRFAATGTQLRVILGGLRYAKYMIGRFKVLPPGRAAIPTGWKRLISQVAAQAVGRELSL